MFLHHRHVGRDIGRSRSPRGFISSKEDGRGGADVGVTGKEPVGNRGGGRGIEGGMRKEGRMTKGGEWD